MDKLKWCLKQKNGIVLIDPNDNLAKAYFSKSADSLETMQLAKAKDWKISAAYYSMYFVARCKRILDGLSESSVVEIRKKLKK